MKLSNGDYGDFKYGGYLQEGWKRQTRIVIKGGQEEVGW